MKTQISFASILLLASATAILVGGWLGRDYGAIVVFIVALACYLFFPNKSPFGDNRENEMERQIQHMQRVEELLQRIAAAVERK